MAILLLVGSGYIAAEIHVQTVPYNFPVSRFLVPVLFEESYLNIVQYFVDPSQLPAYLVMIQ